MRIRALALTGLMALASGLSSCASGPGTTPDAKTEASAVVEDAQCASGNRPYFGDTHLHTSLSPDAGLAGTKLGLDEAYRFARGETVTSNSGQKAALKRPLDFLVVADHAENLGLAQGLAKPDPELLKSPLGKQLADMLKAGKGKEAFFLLVQKMAGGREALISNDTYMSSVWQENTKAAEAFNEPGKFTALIGYEWTSQPSGGNLHRVVVFRDPKDLVDKILPFSAFDPAAAIQLPATRTAMRKPLLRVAATCALINTESTATALTTPNTSKGNPLELEGIVNPLIRPKSNPEPATVMAST